MSKLTAETDQKIGAILKEYNDLRYRVGETNSDYYEGVYRIYDILRETGIEL